MNEIDVAELSAVTKHAHSRLLEAADARRSGNHLQARKSTLNAAEAVCRAMRDIFKPHLEELSDSAPRSDMEQATLKLLSQRQSIREFLNAEEKTLVQAGLGQTLIDAVMDRCVAFLDQEPDRIEFRQLQHAFAAAEFRVCEDAIKRLQAGDEEIDSATARSLGVPILNSAIGATIIGANYIFLGPGEWFFSLSSGYGASWFPSKIRRR